MIPLHPIETRFLKGLSSGESKLEDVAERAQIGIDQARRALEWLKTKGYVESTVRRSEILSLGSKGEEAVEQGLPERILVNLFPKNGTLELGQLRKAYPFSESFSAALGQARALGWVKVKSESGRVVAVLGKVEAKADDELLLRALKSKPLRYENLEMKHKDVLKRLRRRPDFIVSRSAKEVFVKATRSGLVALESQMGDLVDSLTSEDLSSGMWRSRKLRPIDVEAGPPLIYPGKKHPVQRFIDEVRSIFVSLGFEEIEGPIVQPSFWNFDALFTPQDHPARELQDTFYLDGVSSKKLEANELIKQVAETHRSGGTTGSKGWGGTWSEEKATPVVLRTHTTAVTVRYLADFKPTEAKVFSVGRTFRNEKLSYKHLAEFHQYEGIVVGEDVTLRDLMGLLSNFYNHLGLKKVKFWPTYFPYTEPSIQSVVYYEDLGRWVELCGMGIFRPEVTLPLGVSKPVLAWGGGLERLVMLRYGIEDVRQLYRNDLDWLRETPLCL